MKHHNLFNHVEGTGEAYAALQAHFKRDDRNIQIVSTIMIGAVAYLSRNLTGWDFFAVMVLAIGFVIFFATYIDHSNRNFMMHMIDWHRAKEHEKKQADEEEAWRRADRASNI